ncbi:hypothetical protein D3C87_1437540 [compost metagenome]
MATSVWLQSAFQVRSDVALHPTGRHAVAPDLAGQHQAPVGCLDSAALLHLPQSSQQFHCLDLAQPPLTQPRKQIPLKLTLQTLSVTGAPSVFLLRIPLQGNYLERVASRIARFELLHLARQHRVNAVSLLHLGRVSSLACVGQTRGWIATQGHTPLFTARIGLPEPSLRASRAHLQI